MVDGIGPAVPISIYYRPIDHEDPPPGSPRDAVSTETPSAFLETWRPLYLRRCVLLGFLVVFVFIVVAIEGVLAISQRQYGFSPGGPVSYYTSRYGSTAFLTGIAALWARTEYQSKLLTPWIRLSRGGPASDTLLLDYISQFSLFAIATSLRRKDFLVSVTITISIMIKMLIILSSGLVSLSITAVHRDNYPMVLQDTFINSTTGLAYQADLSTFVYAGLRSQNLTFPDGISSHYAFQSVHTDLPDTAETRVTVDGWENSLSCEPVRVTIRAARPPDTHQDYENTLNLTLSSSDCNAKLVSLPDTSDYSSPSLLFARFKPIQCDGMAGDDNKRILVMFGNMTYGILNKSSQLLCSPKYAIKRVLITRNGTLTQNISPVQGVSEMKSESITAWDVMNAHLSWLSMSSGGFEELPFDGKGTANISTTPVDVDTYMQFALDYQLAPSTRAADLFNPVVLQQTVNDFYSQHAAIIVKQSSMKPTRSHTVGSVTINENRLVVHSWIVQWMGGIAAVCALLTVVTLFVMPKDTSVPRSPTNLPDSCAILASSDELLARLCCAGASDDEHLARFLTPLRLQSELISDPASKKQRFRIIGVEVDLNGNPIEVNLDKKLGQFPQVSSKTIYPTTLRPAASSILCLFLISLIIALELLLRKSVHENGLGDIIDNGLHYLWTVFPALVFGALSMFLSSIDFQIRSLAPYMALTKPLAGSTFTHLEFVDATIPTAIYRALKLRAPWAIATTLAFLSASLLTTFSAALFQDSSVPIVTSMTVQANQSFSLSTWDDRDDEPGPITSLILASNYSFPRFTYRDLAFPEFLLSQDMPLDPTLNASTVSITAVVPAIRSRLDCRRYEAAHITTQSAQSDDDPTISDVSVWVDGEGCGAPGDSQYRFFWGTPTSTLFFSYFGQIKSLYAYMCSEYLYLWGTFEYDGSFKFNHIEALGCNVTFEGLDVNTTFVGTCLDFDSQNPPQALEHTRRPTTLRDESAAVYIAYDSLASISNGQPLMGPFFSMLVTSPWALPISDLEEPSASTKIFDAIQFQHGILAAQVLATWRSPANETNATLTGPIGPTDNDAQPVYNATAIDAIGRRRLIQNAAATHTLAALLATSLVFLVLGWATRPRVNILPRSPTSIASIMALFAGGNLMDRLPTDAQSLSREEITNALMGDAGSRFRMGWGNLPDEEGRLMGDAGSRFRMGWGNLPDEEGRLMGGENEAGISRFGIFVID